MFLTQHHKSLEVLHDGTMPPRAYFIPYASQAQALSGERENSSRFSNLSGEWSFCFLDSFEKLTQDITQLDFDISACDKIAVPRCWQTYTDRGYDKPLYSNLQYPFPTDPPHVPIENPCGVYLRDFDAKFRQGERIYIEFEGVSSCFYLFVNGEYCAYSQVSHSSTEIDITDKLKQGSNRLCVVVVKWCDGSYLEDQDFFRLSGIFREVYLLTRPEKHISDIDVRVKLNNDFTKCTINVELTGNANGKFEFVDADTASVCAGDFDGSFSFEVDNPQLWNAEQPYLYTLMLLCEGEYIPIKTGICSKTIENGVFKVNGRRTVFRGVNRHDSHPVGGYALSAAEMLVDLKLIKDANANAIRTSHYPNDPRFTELCSELGLYVIDEADIETHGMGFDNSRDWDWMRWSLLSTLPEWRKAYVDRAALLYERDKNAACVVMWSLGNESGAGVNHRAMAEYIRSRNTDAIIHYENTHKEFKAIPDGEDFSDVSDVESRMYASVEYISEYLADETNTKPFFMCEYVCSMSTGDVYDFFRLADESERFCGGCIWEFCDHAVNVPDENGNARYFYGGDFADEPNDGIGCIDGLVYPDRRPRPGYYDMKKVYEPFSGSYSNGSVTIRNKRDFTTLDDLYVNWYLESDGKRIGEGKILPEGIEPGQQHTYELFDGLKAEEYKKYVNCFLTLSFCRRNSSIWADADYEVGFLQFELGVGQQASVNCCPGEVSAFEDEQFVKASAGGCELCFDKISGCVCSYTKNGRPLIKRDIQFDIWRAPNYNRGSVNEWMLEQFDKVKQRTYSVNTKTGDGLLEIECEISLGAYSRTPVIRMKVVWCFLADGSLTVDCKGTIRKNAPLLPHLGLKLVMPAEFENVEYFGLGNIESYPDRCTAVRYGEYKTSVNAMYEHYLRPQECGNRFSTRKALISDGKIGLFVQECNSFCFKALHYDADDLIKAAHDFELKQADATYLNVDWRVNAISENGEFDKPMNTRRLGDKIFDFGFVLSPNTID